VTALQRPDAQLVLPVLDAAVATSQGARPSGSGVGVRVIESQAAPRPDRPGRKARRRHDLVTAASASSESDPVGAAEGDRLLYTVPEVARCLHIGRRQTWELVWRGELPVVRLGRSVRIARPVLERFVAERSAPYGA
jgi:excisionase family DNA binding protein